MIDARQDRTEATFDLRYSFTKDQDFGIFTQMDGLSIQFRLAYDQCFTIDKVDDDFVDARICIDYVF